LLRRGLGYRESNVSACLNVSADHLGLRGIDTVEQLAEVKRVVVEVATDVAVLNADDPLCLKMADYTEARQLCYVTMNPAHPLVKEHIRANGVAVVLEQGMNGQMITLYDSNGHHIPVVWTHLIPATLEGRALHNVQNAMFAVALAHGLDIDMENIRHGLRTFDTTFFQAPGRMNIYNEHPFKVILDYAHNTAAVRAICQVVERLGADGKKRIVLSAPGDRRDEDIAEIARIVAGQFDYYVCRRDDNTRGRGPTELPELLQRVLLEEGVPAAQIVVIPDEQEANMAALESAGSGDLLLILGDNIKRTWKQIIYFNAGHREDAGKEQPPPAVALAPEDAEAFRLDADMELVRDGRGVRIAREAED
jgi:cyanophycin synthetase